MKVLRSAFNGKPFTVNYITSMQEAAYASKCLLEKDIKYGLDIETAKNQNHLDNKKAGLCPYLSHIRLIQVYDGKDVWIFDAFKCRNSELERFLANGKFIAHNAIFEAKHFTHAHIPKLNIDCSMLMAMMVDRAEHSPFEPDEEDEDEDDIPRKKKKGFGLDAVTHRLYGIWISKQYQVSDWNAAELSNDQLLYAALDAVLTYDIAYMLAPKVKTYKMIDHYMLLKDLQHVVVEMELTGMPVDWQAHEKLVSLWETEVKKAEKACKPYFGSTNLASSPQMGKWLENYHGKDSKTVETWPRTKGGGYTFDRKKILDYWKDPAIKALLYYKKYAKLLNTYGESLAKKKHPLTNRLHCEYSLGETLTGRMSCRNPNLQNQPHDGSLRNIFCADKGNLLVVSDFSQIELRIQGELSLDPVMRENYRVKGDLYKRMASIVYKMPIDKIDKKSPQRQIGKIILLALGFGMGVPKFYRQARLGIEEGGIDIDFTEGDAEKSSAGYKQLFKVYHGWCDKKRDQAAQLGFARTKLGKMRRLLENEVYTKAVNHPVQGSAFELLGIAALNVQKRIAGAGKIVALVHDEIIVDCPKENALAVKEIVDVAMSDAMTQMFPNASSFDVADGAFAERWGDAKK